MITSPDAQLIHVSACHWCQSPIPAGRRRGDTRKYCSPNHRLAFWAALRHRAFADFEAGVITVAMLKGGS